jgi:hypothetical protein
MFVHTVLFWLKPDLTHDQHTKFQAGLNSLLTIPSVVHGSVGTPASTDRPVIDRTYSYGLLTVFRDLDGHDVYQADPIHLAFLKDCKEYWTRVQIYDFE